MRVAIEKARKLAEDLLVGHGTPVAHARLQADLLIESETRGYASHGLLRLPRIVERIRNGVTAPHATGKHEWLGRDYLSVDGERGLGPVVAMQALDAIIPHAVADGIAIATIRNSNHLGMLAWYAEYVTTKELILIASTTSDALVHPWGGRKALIGTNPITVGIPIGLNPLVLDLATGLVSMGKIYDYANRGQAIPTGWALDAEGNPTTDARAARMGAIAPFGGAKGYALGLALEVLVTALSGAAVGTAVQGTLDSNNVCNKGDLFIVIWPGKMAAVRPLIESYLDEIRNSAATTPSQPVLVPGDRSRWNRARAVADGLLLDDDLWQELVQLETSHKTTLQRELAR